ncbi:YceI family protein [Sphingomonas adhaesiva]|uniref:Polyisoprenoid-binding protein n=1 Tax=Sphingomonas adhaesiva TaxID=28212 RepID=A0A2A4I5T4_9SPHN|nr:YceI family protein [Sphingomonas adhaesiva]PCG14337.1 polyisoprenoid-binding protein [Sphingomonas adhaesiva]
MRYVIAAALMAAAVPAVAQMAAAPAMPGAPTTRVAAGTYQVDPAHTQVTWEVNHMGFSMLQGQFGASGGSIAIDPAKPAQTKVNVTFAVADLSVTSSQFATHLKSKDFFDVAANPNAQFVSTAVTPRGANRATMTGNLTIKGITKPVTLDVTFVGAGTNPMTKKLNFGFKGTGTIKRSDFGLGMAVPIVSDEVKLTVNAAFTA